MRQISDAEKQISDEELLKLVAHYLEKENSFKTKILSLVREMQREKSNKDRPDYSKLKEEHPNKYMIVQKGEIILLADTLEELLDNLPETSENESECVMLVPRRKQFRRA